MFVSFKWPLLAAVGVALIWLLWLTQTTVPPVSPTPEEQKTEAMTETPRSYFEPLIPWRIGSESVYASLATTPEARTLGLSYTTALPPDIAKVFIFDTDERWSFWMKEMQYPIAIAWISATGTIVHIEASVSPDTYPNSFTPPLPARYVIETVPGFWNRAGLAVGDTIDMSTLIEKSN